MRNVTARFPHTPGQKNHTTTTTVRLYAFIFVISTVVQNEMREKENIVPNSYSHR